MKYSNIFLFLLTAISLLSIGSCTDKKSANESTILNDTVKVEAPQPVSNEKFNYALGMMLGDNLGKALGLNSKNFNVDEFCSSIADGLASTKDKELEAASVAFNAEAQKLSMEKQQNKPLSKFSPAFSKNTGLNFAYGFKKSGLSAENFKTDNFKKGFICGLGESSAEMDVKTADQILRQEFERLKGIVNQKNADAGKKFLEENLKKNPNLKTTASGIQYEILKAGSGEKPKATDQVTTHYRGTLIDGSEFDSSFKRGTPADFPINGVIKGWTEILQLMPKGSKWKVYIPSDLAYGAQGMQGKIGPNETLIFEIELLKINGK
jgi:FKBP-type peptidyl-prolyl cis-trans isomerase FklB